MDIFQIYCLLKWTIPERHIPKTNYQKDISQIIFFEWLNQKKKKKKSTKPYLTYGKMEKNLEKIGEGIIKMWKKKLQPRAPTRLIKDLNPTHPLLWIKRNWMFKKNNKK